MDDFLESPAFPASPSWGYISEPMYSTIATRASSGREKRVRLWARPLYQYTFQVGPRETAVIQEILEFFHAVGGRDCGFRFHDYADYLSCRIGQVPTRTDQPAIVTSAPLVFQMFKQYTFGTRVQQRLISKPIASQIMVAIGGTPAVAGTDYTLDETTGLLTLAHDPGARLVTWGGQFDVPVRFDSDTLPITLQDRNIDSATFTLTELRL